ncbi:MAG TPA: hypothetical protein VD867_11555, partial [Burkholderiales bacterium]|nr:hypothetical protein [Burkholderiales bacterium]
MRPAGERNTRYALALAALAGLFASRVVAQAVQRWHPLDALPPFHMFQGSSVAYEYLIATQAALLVWMVIATRRVSAGRQPRHGAARVLTWVGGIYMAGSILRIVVGLSLPDAPAWFHVWIPAVFHVVLAGFVLTLAAYHRGPPAVTAS